MKNSMRDMKNSMRDMGKADLESMLVESDIESDTRSFSEDGVVAGDQEMSSKRVPLKPGRGETTGSKMVYAILALAAVTCGLATYLLLTSAQEKEFESEFQSYARETADIAENNAERTFGQLRTLATAVTSIAKDDNADRFPNVTIPHFDLRAQEISELTGAEMILFVPFVERNDRLGWEHFAVENQGWIGQDYDYRGWDASSLQNITEEIYECPWCADTINDTRKGFQDEDGFMEKLLQNLTYDSEGFSAPIAQFGPASVNISLAMFDLFTHPTFKKEIVASLEYDVPVISETIDLDFLLDCIQRNSTNKHELRSFTLDQVKEDFRSDSRTIGYVVGVVPWSTFFVNLLPETVNGIVVKVESDCGKEFTYTINGGKEDWGADGDWHDPTYDHMAFHSPFFSKAHPKGESRHCHFDLVIFPSDEFHDSYKSSAPFFFAGMVGVVFAFTAILFFLYNMVISKRQGEVLDQAARAEAIVNSVFPKEFGERLISEAKLRDVLATGADFDNRNTKSKPLADLFLNTTVMFADICGFTAWSSSREPTQVFTLLESIYKEFDATAKRRRVFKVETVGDCYVAVAGLPNPRKDHYIAMALFAGDCLTLMGVLTRQLETSLGPDTTDLGIRIGLHSGPVTAGVLRGDRARFQLFGDTVNTTARIESTGEKNRIQVSKETATLLEAAGKGHWLTPREDKIVAKGKGELETFWLIHILGGGTRSVVSFQGEFLAGTNSVSPFPEVALPSLPSLKAINVASSKCQNRAVLNRKVQRLVDWNVDVLARLLKQIAARRKLVGIRTDSIEAMKRFERRLVIGKGDGMVSDEVVEIVNLPNFNAKAATQQDHETVELNDEVYSQLRNYVSHAAVMYHDNPFHSFEHASHVTMSVTKLLGRIVAPDITSNDAQDLHDHTYGITSDPLTQFAVVFAAMLHDVDHAGVPNTTLVKEQSDIALHYHNQSVAEQNSVDLAWNFLMESSFTDLRQAIYNTEADFKRFRQLFVNTVMATDIMDKELKGLRNARWDKAFATGTSTAMQEKATTSNAASTSKGTVAVVKKSNITNNRKATIVIEHLIQASDVAHTMQHWQIYRKWNARLFMEMYKAYQEGRAGAEKDPSEFWYEGEIGFFDFYIIPLAKKLEECGVFGVSSHEYLTYAVENRKEWELKGRGIVEERYFVCASSVFIIPAS